MPLALLRLTRILRARPAHGRFRVVAALVVLWLVSASVGAHAGDGAPLASTSTATYAYGQVAPDPGGAARPAGVRAGPPSTTRCAPSRPRTC